MTCRWGSGGQSENLPERLPVRARVLVPLGLRASSSRARPFTKGRNVPARVTPIGPRHVVQFSQHGTVRELQMSQMFAKQKLIALAAVMAVVSGVTAIATLAWAQPAPRGGSATAVHFYAQGGSAVASFLAGYSCPPYTSMTIAKGAPSGSVAVRLHGYLVSYVASPSRLSPSILSYPGSLKVTEGARTWSLPRPTNPGDQYFQLGGLCAVQFAPGTAPDVLAEGYSGGAHCCYGPTLYGYSPVAHAYRVVEDLTKPGAGKGLHWNPNAGFQPRKIGPAVVLESSDGAFAYTFGCYACTPTPTRIFTLADGRLQDVTTRYPALIRAEATMAWDDAARSMRSSSGAGTVEGPLAEWAADECELDQSVPMWATLAQLQAKGSLAAAEAQSFNHTQPFPVQLKSFLARQGYCAG